jgi:hypothetical protein
MKEFGILLGISVIILAITASCNVNRILPQSTEYEKSTRYRACLNTITPYPNQASEELRKEAADKCSEVLK